MTTKVAASLEGLRVLVTRPAHQAEPFCTLLAQAGAEAVRFPVLAIAPAADPAAVAAVAERLDQFDLLIFISVNAVQYGLEWLPGPGDWPTSTAIAAVGSRTAAALVEEGLSVTLVPETGHNSEALLALPALQDMRHRRVLIVRGNGGRETLAEALRARGAEVTYAEVYRRVCPDSDAALLLRRWQKGGVDVVTVTSVESLRNLFTLLGPAGEDLLRATPLVVASERVRAVAQELDCHGAITVAADATDAGMLMALRQWRQQDH